ncbi:MAG: hypothetical protein KGZ88_20195 [Methylomicrobium sp.]|nr:hypothetical protein [Methylomicrobium sp.]
MNTNNLYEVREFFLKNIKEIIHALGYSLIKVKKRDSKTIKIRLANQNKVIAAHKQKPSREILVKKYFTVDIEAKPGINHLREALNWLIRESIYLNRTPLVFTPQFDSIHNYDIEISTTWSKYIDLKNIKINDINIQAVENDEVTNLEDLSILWIERNHIITDNENEEFDLIIRHNKTGLKIDNLHDFLGITEQKVQLPPSKRVLETYTQVRNQLKNYTAMHVRRGDMLSMTDKFPHLDEDTKPDKIKEKISQIIPKGSNIYILTNERNPDFFNPLKNDYEILQYYNFPELQKIVACKEPDNFLLFEIEKLIFESANTKIYTFTHPEGGVRISLCKDLGWA